MFAFFPNLSILKIYNKEFLKSKSFCPSFIFNPLCNTNQTILSLEISSCLPQDHLVFTIEKVVNTLEDCHFHAFYHAFGRPSYHLKMLVSTLLFAYSQGIFSGRKIEKMMIENLAMQYLTGQLVVSYRTINRFRVAEGMEELIRKPQSSFKNGRVSDLRLTVY